MIEIKFLYKERIIPIKCNKNEKFEEIFHKFETKIGNNSVYFLYKGNKINKKSNLVEIIEKDDINNINILVNSIDEINNK